jgi:hypothetical protein
MEGSDAMDNAPEDFYTRLLAFPLDSMGIDDGLGYKIEPAESPPNDLFVAVQNAVGVEKFRALCTGQSNADERHIRGGKECVEFLQYGVEVSAILILLLVCAEF